MQNQKLIYLFLDQNMFGYSKEPFHRDGSFEHPKHMLKLMDKKIFTILLSNILFIWTSVNAIKMWCIFFQIRCLSEDKKHNCSMVAGGDTERAVVKKLLEDQTYRIQMAAITSHGLGEWSKLYIVGKWFLCMKKKNNGSWSAGF